VLFPADDVRLGPLLAGLWVEGDDARVPPEGGVWQALPSGVGWGLEGGAVLLPDGAPLPADLAGRPALAGAEAERLRMARGEPAAPAELNEEVNPFELGLAARVSLSKGCYAGQETLAKLATYDGVKQQLRRWHLPAGEGAGAPAAGAELRDADGQRSGVVTSVLALPEGGWIGLALVRRAALAAPRLRGPGAGWLEISMPEWVQPPPVGAGGRQSGGESSGGTGT
jgi:folate-binding protein YgfZ